MLMLTIGIWRAGWIKFTLFPKVESDLLVCSLTMPAGTPVERTSEIAAHLERSAREALADMDRQRRKDALPLFKRSITSVGRHAGGRGPMATGPQVGGHLAQIRVELLEGELRDVSATELATLWRKKVGTSLTTFAGLTPILLERSLQAQFLIPMAISLGFGVLFATGITLLLVPSGYMILEDIHNLLANLKAKVVAHP
jgi:hypothetical protein